MMTRPAFSVSGSESMWGKSFGFRALSFAAVPAAPIFFNAVSTADVFPIPDGPSTTTPRPGVRKLTISLVYSVGSTNVYVGTPEIWNTCSRRGRDMPRRIPSHRLQGKATSDPSCGSRHDRAGSAETSGCCRPAAGNTQDREPEASVQVDQPIRVALRRRQG